MFKRFYFFTGKLGFIIVILLAAGLWQFATAGWIQGKAILAQQLLNQSWRQTISDSSHKFTPHKPWPWADTWPVAKLMAPQHDIEQIVLSDDSGSSLAFGPGHSLSSATPNTAGLTMISGHRDTHFSFLKDLKINDTINLQTANKTISYRVYDHQIVDSSTFILENSDEQILVLVTCYPFEAITSGGSLRYLIYADKQNVKEPA